jgi:hypothetical protein
VERGTWTVERGTWNVERGTWNVERGTWNGGLWTVDCGLWEFSFFDLVLFSFFTLNFSFGKTQQKTKIVWACTKFNWFGVYNDVLFLFAIDKIYFGHF